MSCEANTPMSGTRLGSYAPESQTIVMFVSRLMWSTRRGRRVEHGLGGEGPCPREVAEVRASLIARAFLGRRPRNGGRSGSRGSSSALALGLVDVDGPTVARLDAPAAEDARLSVPLETAFEGRAGRRACGRARSPSRCFLQAPPKAQSPWPLTCES